jgi:hypothetical protein
MFPPTKGLFSMNINQFKQHLQHINGSVYGHQKSLNLNENKQDQTTALSDEDLAVLEIVDQFYGGLEEITPDHIIEVAETYTNLAVFIKEFIETGDEEMEEVVYEYFNSYFNDELMENVEDADINEAIENLEFVCDLFENVLMVEHRITKGDPQHN